MLPNGFITTLYCLQHDTPWCQRPCDGIKETLFEWNELFERIGSQEMSQASHYLISWLTTQFHTHMHKLALNNKNNIALAYYFIFLLLNVTLCLLIFVYTLPDKRQHPDNDNWIEQIPCFMLIQTSQIYCRGCYHSNQNQREMREKVKR